MAGFKMFKQLGISSVELLLSLAVISSVSAYTLTLSDEVEKSINTYQHETNVRDMLKKVRSSSPKIENIAQVDNELTKLSLEPDEMAVEVDVDMDE